MQKTLRLLYKSNPTLFEWFSSPIVYQETEFADNYNESKKPSFRSDRYQFTVVMPKLNYNVLRNDPQKKETNPLEIQILNMIKKDNKISTEKMAMTLGISSKTVKRHIKDIGIVRFIGRGSNGHWEIIDD